MWGRSRELNLHQIALEEFIQIPLSSRVREVPNVETTSLSNNSDDSLVLNCVGFTAGCVGSRCRFILDIGSSQRVSNIVDGRHDELSVADWK